MNLSSPSLRRCLLALLAGLSLAVFSCDSQDESTGQNDAVTDTPDDGDADDAGEDTDTLDIRDTPDSDQVMDAGPDWELSMFDVPPEECDDSLRPIVFAHGFLASGDTFANHVARFRNNGYCAEQLHVFDWNTLAGAGDLDWKGRPSCWMSWWLRFWRIAGPEASSRQKT